MLGWDPTHGTRWVPPLDQVRAQLAATGRARAPWRLATGSIVPGVGSEVHLMLQGRLRGLVGRGVVRTGAYLAGDPEHLGSLAPHVLIEWDRLQALDDAIGLRRLEAEVPDVPWREAYGQILQIPPDAVRDLDRVWGTPAPGRHSDAQFGGSSAAPERGVADITADPEPTESAIGPTAEPAPERPSTRLGSVLHAVLHPHLGARR